MGWEGKEMGKQDGGRRSRPIPPGRCPYLNCRRDTGLSHSPPNRAQQPPQMDVGKRVPGPAKKGWAGRVPGGPKCKSARVPECAGQGLLLVSASGQGMGVSVVRLRAVGEAKDVIVQLPPRGPKYLRRLMVVGTLPC